MGLLVTLTVSLALSTALLIYGTQRPHPRMPLRVLILRAGLQRGARATLRLLCRPARILLAVPPARDTFGRPDGRQRMCPACRAQVSDAAPHLRHRGRVYHAQPCVERHPPGEQLHAVDADKGTHPY